MPTRRGFLRGLAGSVTALTVLSGGATARYEQQPTHVTLTYDEGALKRYRPLFVTWDLNVKPVSLRSWVATSSEFDTHMYCYWAYYTVQEGVSSEDSHIPDREPFYVEVDPNTNSIVGVHYDHYHYLRRTDLVPPTTDDGRPTYRIIKPWHPYQPTTEEGVDVPISNLHERYQPWLDNGWNVHRPAVVNPWEMKTRTHWWPEGTFGIETVDEFSALWYNINQHSPWTIPQPGRDT